MFCTSEKELGCLDAVDLDGGKLVKVREDLGVAVEELLECLAAHQHQVPVEGLVLVGRSGGLSSGLGADLFENAKSELETLGIA